ncbi:MAG: tRNA (guanine-N(1)-)-methyltransferase [Candidatus Gottesmanbacteria bacterium GW2011_GWA2_47_9]|uniref:tRNA (guanine-N(1)-)-methyltransferase n=1 Tax=Candidatus Gottesmanbacteria bacterium GW2011_GWA2_47_9 TaxID=1618445 RepID=A0A0G1X0P1_9BACT|nr:MAG: tRNA (guanine-N(1)-)-methyltransferase [Candidatus Gottesmanbacteria bacterium GW2011_GWA2_47_9]
MNISILTLFPEMFSGPFTYSIVKRAQEKGTVTIDLVNIRDFATDNYKSVDDHPYGGGAGMILRVDVVDRALKETKLKIKNSKLKIKTILLDPQGTQYTQNKAATLSTLDHLILVCGHYEGVDERIRQLVDEELSVGDYITTGGEIPAMIVVDTVVRLLPGVLKHPEAIQLESFSSSLNSKLSALNSLLEYPQYTRPEIYNGVRVPDVLLSGDHKKIDDWRENQAIIRTKKRRPDLVKRQRDRVPKA